MPFNSSTNKVERLYRFVDQFAAGQEIRRGDFDATLDDLVAAINNLSVDIAEQIAGSQSVDLYLGASSTNPTVGIGGAALVPYNVFVKIPEYELRVYDGAAWRVMSNLADATTFFEQLSIIPDSAGFRAALGLGSAATADVASLATSAQLVAQANLTANARTPRTTSGSAASLTLTSVAPVTALAAGQAWLIRTHLGAIGPTTINIDGRGAQSIKKLDATNNKVDIEAGDWTVGAMFPVFFDGTDIIIPRYAVLGQGAFLDAPSQTDLTVSPSDLVLRSVLQQILADKPTKSPNAEWVDRTSARLANTDYQNTTPHIISVSLSLADSVEVEFSPDGVTWVSPFISDSDADTGGQGGAFDVMPGHYYRSTGAFTRWHEHRDPAT